MSYRAFKRLLGETSLERKCRFLFGGFILLLISASFSLYAYQTEHLAYEQIPTTCRLLVNQIVDHLLTSVCKTVGVDGKPVDGALPVAPDTARALADFRRQWEKNWPRALKEYRYRLITPNATKAENKPDDPYGHEQLNEFINNPDRNEENKLFLSRSVNHYYAAIRASKSCMGCHTQLQGAIKENDLLAMIQIDVDIPIDSIEKQVHINRAILISNALITALLIMGGSYLIVRYVIVKPVKHLKEVSDAISAGELNVRSEIQTGDEFEDLSHAFNRMLRNLVSMQDRLKKVNTNLDRKVDELAHANLALFESNKLKSDFLAKMSHELRTPLNSILGFSDLLINTQNFTEKHIRWAGNIRSSGEQLLSLINEILDLAKIEAGKMEVSITEFRFDDVSEGLLTMARPLAEKKNIDLQSVIPADIKNLRQDRVKLRQILANLLSNAVKFTPEGGKVVLKVEQEGKNHCMTVSDTGVGIAPEEQELVFEKFRQAGNTLTREHDGTGLGLSIVRELTKLLGGEVSLQSELGKGSTFTVVIPIELSTEPRLEVDLYYGSVDFSKARRVEPQLEDDGSQGGKDPETKAS
ncbi:MAG: HAMP domain-containing protein [Planctomycetota bacterium]|nr:MAG: HAMP domain-containing protein [Planctomycetota bacterium]RLS90578.1 MAG: HAMP domain-containing protein [Planctomycetota bacterium]